MAALSKARRGSEPFGTGSESAANDVAPYTASRTDAGGRPPVLTDDQLYALAGELLKHLGRPPRLNELIEHSGGCQRQRASRILQQQRLALAEKAVRSQLILPQDLEAEHRAWVDRWMQVAATQLAERHAQLDAEHERAIVAANELIAEQHQTLAELREQLEDQRRIAGELAARTRDLTTETSQLRAERDVALAVSDERLRLLDALRPANRTTSKETSK
jgi:hypothetical protein